MFEIYGTYLQYNLVFRTLYSCWNGTSFVLLKGGEQNVRVREVQSNGPYKMASPRQAVSACKLKCGL